MAGWQTKPIGDAFRVVNGGTPKTGVPVYWDGPHHWITPAEMGGLPSPYLSASRRTLTDEGLRVGAELVPANSIILSTRAPIGHLVINEVPMAFNQGCKGLVPLSGIETKFAYYFLLANVPLLDSLGTGATFKELSGGKLKEVLFSFPSLPEQRRIVAILDEAFEGIATAKANAEKNLQNAREVFEASLQDTFSGGSDGAIPTTLGAVCRFVGGSQPPKSDFVTSPRAGYVRLIQIRDYKSDAKAVYIPRELARRFCAPDDVMIGRYGPPLFQILRGLEGAYNVALMKAAPDESVLSKGYLYYFLRHRDILNYIIASSARAAGQIGLNKETIEPYPIHVPCLQSQAETVSRLERLEAATEDLIRNCERKLAALDDLKKSLLQQAFSGAL